MYFVLYLINNILNNLDKNMSGIIDDIIFQALENIQSNEKQERQSTRLYEIFNKLKVNQKCQVLKNNPQAYQTVSTFDSSSKSFLVNLNIKKESFNTKLTIVSTNDLLNHKISSKHCDLLVMKQYFKRHKEFPAEANIYINNGRTYMVMNNYFPKDKLVKSSKIVEVYNTIISKNLINFQNFIKKYIENRDRRFEEERGNSAVFTKQLQIARILNTTQSTTNLDIQKSQFKQANSILQKRKLELNLINQNIVQQINYQTPAQRLYSFVPEEVSTSWLKTNYIPFYLEHQKKLNATLNLSSINTQKKLEDFVYNEAKINVKEMIGGNKPYNEGGFSYIFGARAEIYYLSSSDLTQLPQNTQRAEKFIAIKKLKPAQLKKPRNKLQHQKSIIQKMRGSTCQFLPKYYGTQLPNQLQNTLVMELFQGDELDYYILSRTETISLWSKIYLLLNVLHGIRHLISYKITHLDLKPINVLVIKNMITKLIDYGEAYHSQICPKNYMPGVTFPYTAPEVVVRNIKIVYNKPDNQQWQYSQKQDAYSFGVMLYEIIFGSTIFHLTNNKFKEVYFKRESAKRFFMAPERAQDYGEDFILSSILYIVVRCMDPNPVNRPCFQWIGISLKLILNSYINIS